MESKLSDLRTSSFPKKRKMKVELPQTCTSDEEPYTDPSASVDCCETVLVDGKEHVYFPVSKWDYEDLKNLNIFFEERPEPFEEFMLEVKENFMWKCDCPDFNEDVRTFSQMLKETVAFSYDLQTVCQLSKHMYKNKKAIEQKIIDEIECDVQKAKEGEKDLNLNDLLNRKWMPAVKRFAEETLKLIKMSLYPLEEGDLLSVKIEREKERKRAIGQERKENSPDVPQDCFGSFLKHFSSVFGQMFFLEPDSVTRKTFYFMDKLVDSTPDSCYLIHREPVPGVIDAPESILSVSQVKQTIKMNDGTSLSLEEQLGSRVLGQIGAGLFAETNFSLIKPNSLGIIYSETKIIFVYLKLQNDHYVDVLLKTPLTTEGRISYTQPFDMLNAEDRLKISDFFYFLGCLQNKNK
ncbi:uncharacterized protein LOC133194512 [Saccostrea echinata]|uniref:uncharacterized protein LOC133194512 n=1 Tax=Saccostrea echinata TaxID=191078 RepID=UPI002A7ECD89|nr:uncharacterized protein LOC133194512 [Saccostrea echinata]